MPKKILIDQGFLDYVGSFIHVFMKFVEHLALDSYISVYVAVVVQTLGGILMVFGSGCINVAAWSLVHVVPWWICMH